MPLYSAPPDHENPDKERLRRIGSKVRKRLTANEAVQRIAVAKAEIWAVARFFDAVECGRLISLIDGVAKPSVAHNENYERSFRTSCTGDLDPRNPFVRSLEQRIDGLLGMEPTKGEPMQGQRYLAGQEFKPHSDWFPPNSRAWDYEWKLGGQRALTAMAFLNRVEEGGETDFPNLGIAVEPRPGTLLIWNNADENGVPNPWTVHAGNPVAQGVKYIVTKWYRCRPWRPLNSLAQAPRR